MATRIRLDTREFDVRLAAMRRPQAPIARALNRSIATGQTLAARLISQEMGLKVSTVKKFLRVRKATGQNLTATLYASAKRVPLIEFKARGPEPSRGRPGGVRSGLSGGAPRLARAFIATMPTGHRGVFERNPGAGRLKIHEKFGPSVWQSFKRVEPEVRARVSEQANTNIAHEVAYALARSSGV